MIFSRQSGRSIQPARENKLVDPRKSWLIYVVPPTYFSTNLFSASGASLRAPAASSVAKLPLCTASVVVFAIRFLKAQTLPASVAQSPIRARNSRFWKFFTSDKKKATRWGIRKRVRVTFSKTRNYPTHLIWGKQLKHTSTELNSIPHG